MIEHLVSPEVSVELLRLTSFLRSQHPVAQTFRDAYRASPRSCAEHAPGACDMCGATCLRESLVHSLMVQEQRRLLASWNLFLAILTFSLSLLGTFLVRSGVLSSVHAFAVDPGRGAYILAFLALVVGGAFGVFLWRGGQATAICRTPAAWAGTASIIRLLTSGAVPLGT